jgi:hypothetical protein
VVVSDDDEDEEGDQAESDDAEEQDDADASDYEDDEGDEDAEAENDDGDGDAENDDGAGDGDAENDAGAGDGDEEAVRRRAPEDDDEADDPDKARVPKPGVTCSFSSLHRCYKPCRGARACLVGNCCRVCVL